MSEGWLRSATPPRLTGRLRWRTAFLTGRLVLQVEVAELYTDCGGWALPGRTKEFRRWRDLRGADLADPAMADLLRCVPCVDRPELELC